MARSEHESGLEFLFRFEIEIRPTKELHQRRQVLLFSRVRGARVNQRCEHACCVSRFVEKVDIDTFALHKSLNNVHVAVRNCIMQRAVAVRIVAVYNYLELQY